MTIPKGTVERLVKADLGLELLDEISRYYFQRRYHRLNARDAHFVVSWLRDFLATMGREEAANRG